jgi:alpha-methylacyl-CoA racemase
MTGWGQDGPLAQAAGHDMNYVALTGLLSLSAHKGQAPIVPPTVLGDAAGALGMASASPARWSMRAPPAAAGSWSRHR